MTQQIINTGNTSNDGTGEALRSAFISVNENFTELYAAGPVGTNVSIAGNVITVLGRNNNLVLKGNGVGNVQANSSIIPSIDAVYDLGAPATRFDTVYSTYFVGNGSLLTGITVSGGTAIVNGNSNVSVSANSVVTIGVAGTGNVVTFGDTNTTFNTNISAAGNITGSYFIGNGSQLTGIIATNSYGNANVAANLAAFGTNPISTTGNIAGSYFIGNGALLTGIASGSTSNIANGTSNVTVASSSNITIGVAGSTVATFASTGEYVTGLVSATGNVKGNYLLGNGSQLSNVLTVSQYTTGNISNVVPNVHGLLFDTTTGFSVTDMGNGNALITLGSSFKTWEVAGQTSLVAVGEDTVKFVDGNNIVITTNALSTPQQIKFSLSDNVSVSGNITGGNLRTIGSVSATGNVSGNYFIGNGSQLTGLPASYGNANVAANLAAFGTNPISTSGNITGGYILGNGSQLTGIASSYGNANVVANLAALGTNPISTTGNISGNYFVGNGSQLTGVIASGGSGNTTILGTPSDSSLTGNTVAYQGWTANTYVTDGLDDLNQVALNIAGNTFVGNTYITSNVYAGPSPLSVSLTGRYIGNPNSYLWQFGDGTANVITANATHTFSNTLGGTYTVTYTAYNTTGTNAGNAAAGAKGSTSTATATITLYTPTPIPAFTANRTSLDTPNGVQITNSSQYSETYSINWGDGTIVIPATNWTTAAHVYTNATANTDVLYGVNLTGNSANAGASPVSVTSSNTNVKVYSSQASNVFVTANVANVINGVGTISFRNDSTGNPGNTASFGAQQLYNFNWGDGTVSNVNIATGIAGNPGAANVTHAFALSAANQSGNKYEQYTANLYVYTGYSTSPARSGNITITIEPQTRANFVGATANVTTDATANVGNARVGYLYTDYNGANRSTFTFQNTSENSNIANWAWGDSTFSNGVSNVGNVVHTYTTTGAKTVSLTANGTPNGITSTAQSNTSSVTGYIFIAANPSAPANLSGYANLTIANASQFTNAPLLAAGATDASGGNIPANGTSITRFVTSTPIMTAANVVLANTATTGTLTAYVNNAAAGNVTFTTSGNTAGTTGALVIAADQDLHVANAAVPSLFYKVFSANISCALGNLSTGYNNYKLSHTVSGNTNYVGFVKDNLNSVPTLATSNVVMVEATAGTYRYISGIPYYNTGGPTITIANLQVANLAGQTFTSTNPFILDSGTVSEGSGSVVAASQTKSLAGIDNAANSMLTGSNVKANIGVGSNYILGNLTANLGGTNNSVSTLQANILNVVGTSATVQLPTKIQMYAGANSGVNEQSITASITGNTQAAVRVVMSSAGNTPAFANTINYYTSNVWSGAQTIANTPEAVVRYGVLTNYVVNLSTGYLPVGPNLAVGGNRTSTQYFTFAFARSSLANFDIRLTSTTGIAGLWIAAPNTTIDRGGYSSPVPGFPGPTSTINGWLEGFVQYSGSGVPGASNTGGNGSNGGALTGADVIPLNTSIANVAYTMTLGSQNAANSFGNNILVRIALASGQTITALSIGTAT